MTVLVLDRPRHEQIIKEIREAGARIKLISDGDVGGAIEVAKLGAPVDVLYGIGGTPEGKTAKLALCFQSIQLLACFCLTHRPIGSSVLQFKLLGCLLAM